MSDVPFQKPPSRARRTVLISGALGFLAAVALIATLASFGHSSGAEPRPAAEPAPVSAVPPQAGPPQIVAPPRPDGPRRLIPVDRSLVGDGQRPMLQLAPGRPAQQR